MLIIPAIDLDQGQVVRFVQGKLDKKVYSLDPVKTALHWARQGAQLLHIVDLDGAKSGVIKNLDIVKEIVKKIDIPVEFGGGVRSEESLKALFAAGVWRVILGTKAVKDRAFLVKMREDFKDKIIVSLDAKDETIALNGWQDDFPKVSLFSFALQLKELGFSEVIYTDIAKDGTLKGPNIKSLKQLLKETGLKVISSGGISSLDDLRRLKALEKKGVSAVIIGKALYEGKFTLAQALKYT